MQTPTIHYVKSWFIFFLIATAGGGLLGSIVGGILGGILGVAGVPVASIRMICGIAGFVVALPISFFTFQWSVRTYIINPLVSQLAQQSPA